MIVGAKYTIHVYDLWQNGFFDGDTSPLADYPIFNEEYRQPLNQFIIDYYMSHEIGTETEKQFYYLLKARMWAIMPKLNVLFESRGLISRYDPLEDHDYVIRHAETGTVDTQDDNRQRKDSTDDFTGNVHVVTDGTYRTVTRQSDTPQQDINHLGYSVTPPDQWIDHWLTYGEIVDNTHEDETTTDTVTRDVYGHTQTDNRTVDTDTTRNWTRNHSGRQTPGQVLAKQLSELAFDIEMELIDFIRPCFMMLYDT